MALHTWCDHVVHIELLSGDAEVAKTTAEYLERFLATEDVDVSAEPRLLQVRSDVDKAVTAARVAEALSQGGVRAQAVHGRDEWSVAQV